MSYTFRMVFHGIIAIVKEANENGKGSRFHAIVPNTIRGSWDGTGSFPEEVAPDGKSKLSRHVPRCSAFPRRRLDHVRIVVDGLPGTASPIDPGPVQSLPRMKAVVGAALAPLDPYYWSTLRSSSPPSAPAANDPPSVLAFLTMDRGELTAGGGSCAELKGLVGASGAKDTKGMLATTATWEVQGVSDPITVRLLRLKDGKEVARKEYSQLADFPNGVATVELFNDCKSSTKPNDGHCDEDDDPDFRWYYRMLWKRGKLKGKVLPYPRNVGPKVLSLRFEPPVGIVGVNCRPALFED